MPSKYRPPEYKPSKKWLRTSISPGLIFGILRYIWVVLCSNHRRAIGRQDYMFKIQNCFHFKLWHYFGWLQSRMLFEMTKSIPSNNDNELGSLVVYWTQSIIWWKCTNIDYTKYLTSSMCIYSLDCSELKIYCE